MDFLPLHIYFIAISLLVSLTVYFKENRSHPYLKLFPPFLFLTLFIESYCSYLAYIDKNNTTIYNFFSTFEFCFYLFFISRIIISKTVRNVLYITSIAYALICCYNIVYILHYNAFHITTYAIGCLLVALACAYYFFELFQLPVKGKLQNNPAFWICTGLLFFYCCSFPLFGFIKQWSTISKLIVATFENIMLILNIFLYSLFTIGFLCIKTRKFTLSRSSALF